LLLPIRPPYITFTREKRLQENLHIATNAFNERMDTALDFYNTADKPLREAILQYAADHLQMRYENTYKHINSAETLYPTIDNRQRILETLRLDGQLKAVLKDYDYVMLSVLENLDEAKNNPYLQNPEDHA